MSKQKKTTSKNLSLPSVLPPVFIKLDSTTALGRAMLAVAPIMDQYRRESLNEATRKAMLCYQREGLRMSNLSPYGWMVNPKAPTLLVKDPAEQLIIKQIVALRKSGLGLRPICRKLTDEGLRSRSGKWHHSLIAGVLMRAGN